MFEQSQVHQYRRVGSMSDVRSQTCHGEHETKQKAKRKAQGLTRGTPLFLSLMGAARLPGVQPKRLAIN
eukprot:15231870-Alexandrium_andersonii.AAC.1